MGGRKLVCAGALFLRETHCSGTGASSRTAAGEAIFSAVSQNLGTVERGRWAGLGEETVTAVGGDEEGRGWW